jgi:hypothetical protein
VVCVCSGDWWQTAVVWRLVADCRVLEIGGRLPCSGDWWQTAAIQQLFQLPLIYFNNKVIFHIYFFRFVGDLDCVNYYLCNGGIIAVSKKYKNTYSSLQTLTETPI